MLATIPVATGSPIDAMTIGIVVVARFAARLPGVPCVTIRSGTNQVSRQFRKSLVMPLCKAVDDGNVRALDITEVAQT